MTKSKQRTEGYIDGFAGALSIVKILNPKTGRKELDVAIQLAIESVELALERHLESYEKNANYKAGEQK